MDVKPKLSMLKQIEDCGMELNCAWLKTLSKNERMMMLQLRGGTAAFKIKTGRWHGVSREDRVCKECGSGEVEDVSHWLLRCAALEELRQPLVQFQPGSTSNWK